MSLWRWLGQRIGLSPRFNKFWRQFGGNENESGETVTPDRTLGIAAYGRAVRLWATTISTLPLNFYERTSPDADPVLVTSGIYRDICCLNPNEDLTPSEFWEAIVGAERSSGNAYAEKKRLGGRLVSLELLDPLLTEPYRKREAGFRLFYRGTRADGSPFDLPATDVFQHRGFSMGGDVGLSPIQLYANAIGNLQSANKASGRMLRSGLSASGFLETGQVLNEPDRKRLEEIMDNYVGSERAGKMMLLEGGMKFNRMSLSAVDAQLLLQIGFGIEEIARIQDIPPILLGHSQSGQTMWGSGVEAIIQGWYTLGLRAELKRLENAIGKRIIEVKDRGRIFAKFNVDGLLRGDSAAQAALFGAAAQNGWMTRNEIRKLLDLPPLPGGDELTCQVNMALVKDIGSVNQNTSQQARNALLSLLGLEAKNQTGEVGVLRPQAQPITVNLEQNTLARKREKTTITKFDDKGRVLEYVREEQ